MPPEPRSRSRAGLDHGIEHGEIVADRERAAGEFQEAVAVIRLARKATGVERGLKGAVGREQIHVPGGIGRRTAAGHPDGRPGAAAVRGGIEGGRLRQSGLAEGDDPARIRRRIAVRSKARIDGAVRQQQRRTLRVLACIEGHRAALHRVGRADRDGAIELFRAGGDIERVQPLVIVGGAVLGHRHEVKRAVRPGTAVDHRRGRDADLRADLAAAVHRLGRALAAVQQRDVPQRRAAVGIEGVHRVIFGGDEHDVVRGALDAQPREVQGLCVHLAVGREEAQQPEAARVHVGCRQDGLGEVLPGTRHIVLVGRDVGAAGRRLAGLIRLAWGAASTHAAPAASRG